MGLFSRMTVLENGTKTDLKFIECPDIGTKKILFQLGPGEKETIRANKYHQICNDSHIHRNIEVRIVVPPNRNERLGYILTPSQIKSFGKISFLMRTIDQTPGPELDPEFKEVSYFKRIKPLRGVTRMKKKKARPTEAEDVKVSISPEETLPIHAQGSSVVPEPELPALPVVPPQIHPMPLQVVPPGQAVPPDPIDVEEDNLEDVELDDDLNRNREMDIADDHTLAY